MPEGATYGYVQNSNVPLTQVPTAPVPPTSVPPTSVPPTQGPQWAPMRAGLRGSRGPIRVGVLVWAAVLVMIGLLYLIIAVAGTASAQVTMTALLALAGLVFIGLSVYMTRRPGQETAGAETEHRSTQADRSAP